MHDLTIRRATRGDADGIAELVDAAGLPTAGVHDVWLALVAGSSEALAGVVALERHGHDGSSAFLLRSLAVQPDRRGVGVGAALVTAALDAADSADGSRANVGLLTETADGYFARFGFRPVRRDDLPAALAASPELTGACPAGARAYLRTGSEIT